MSAQRELYIKAIKLDRERPHEDSYAFHIPVLNGFEELRIFKPVTFFAGENGMGKSTLLEAIAAAYGFNAEGGTKNFHFASKETHSELHRSILLAKGTKKPNDGFFLRAESFYNVATEIDRLEEIGPMLQSYGGKSLHSQSHGESFLSLVLNRFGGNGLYLLDEPEAALSVQSQLALLGRMDALVKCNAQFIIATHSPILLAYPDADIYVFNGNGITKTPYKETEAYTLSKQFLDQPERMMRYLFEP